LTGKYFGPGDAPNIIHMSEAGQEAMTQCRALGYRIEYTRAGILIVYPPPSDMRAFAYSLDDFLAMTRSILAFHDVDLSGRPADGAHSPPGGEDFSGDGPGESVERLVALSRKVIEQRDAWRSRAMAAERELAALRAQGIRGGAGEGRYGKLKRVIAQELHPDNQIGARDKQLKAEIFKIVWRRVQDIEKEG